jgi:two-component system chemotaxis sensor kinase CheA
MSNSTNEPMLEMFLFETEQLLEQLEQVILASEKSNAYSEQDINEIFRIMHTIKGSSAMMLYENISNLAHSMEDLFYFIREYKPPSIRFLELTDLVLKGADFIKTELAKLEASQELDGDSGIIIHEIDSFLTELKKLNPIFTDSCDDSNNNLLADIQSKYTASDNPASNPASRTYKAHIYFDEDCQMENTRAFSIIHDLKELVYDMRYYPEKIMDDDESENIIKKDGFIILFKTDSPIEAIRETIMQAVFIKSLKLEELNSEEQSDVPQKQEKINSESDSLKKDRQTDKEQAETHAKTLSQNMISVNINKLDKLMDLVGELVTSESMVTQNIDLKDLELENFDKASRQLRKIIGELQDTVMSIRMVPLSATFQKMNRIVRDMSRKLNKNIRLEIIGEETEVDKNIIEHISDPLMHLIRNAIDHGIEPKEERLSKGKNEDGRITLEAKNAGGDVLIIVKDDGRGLNREKILEKARANGLVDRPEHELSDRDVYSFTFLPGFSTKDNVSEYSGRGVGMDVVTKNIEKINGSVSIDSMPDKGTSITLKIPLTLAIIGGMNIKVGNSTYTIPTISIRESFRPGENDVFNDTEGNEMIMIRGQCYRIIRLHQYFKVHTEITRIHEGILIMVETDTGAVCIFADELLGEQQVVVKALPHYIKKVKGLAGCTLLGNGDISLILDITRLADY